MKLTTTNASTRNLSRQMLRCDNLLTEYDSISQGPVNWAIRNDLSRASRALLLKDIPEMNHMVAVLRGYGNGRKKR